MLILSRLLLIFLAAISLGLEARPAYAQGATSPIPVDAQGFTAYIAGLLQANVKDQNVQVVSPLNLRVQAGTRDPLPIDLDNVFTFCTGNRDACPSTITQYVTGVSGLLRDRALPIEKSMLRVALRPAEMVEAAQKQLRPGTPPLVSRPFVADLAQLLVLDLPSSTRPANTADLKVLALSADDAFTAGLDNLRASFKPLMTYDQPLADRTIRVLTESPYESSRLLMGSDWAGVASLLGGTVIAVVPAYDAVIYGRANNPAAVDALRALARESTQKTDRPLSATVLRWTAGGWEEIR